MMRPSRLRQAARWTVTALLLAALSGCGPELRRFVIFHSSDVHGQLEARPARWHKANPKRLIGGYATFKRYLAQETLPYIVVDSGDLYQGTPEGNLTRGVASIDAMNAVGYTASVIGNHEYDYGEENLRALIKRARFPMLNANIRVKATGKPVDYHRPTHVVEVAGVRVGLMGITTHTTAWTTLPKNVAHLTFGSEAKAAREYAAALRRAGAEVVVALSHCGLAKSVARKRLKARDFQPTASDLAYRGDLQVARAGGVDLVLGGHMHIGFDRPWVDPDSKVPIVQSFTGLIGVSRVEIIWDASNERLVSITGRFDELWVDRYGSDPAVQAIADRVGKEVTAKLEKTIGAATRDLKRVEPGLDSPLGNWISDVLRAAAGADVAIQNTHGIRGDLFAGPIRMRDLYEVLPFENTLVTLKMTGAQLEAMLRSYLKGGNSSLQVSGLEVRYRLGPDGETPAPPLQIRVGSEALDPKRLYLVATNNYLASADKIAKKVPSTDTGRSLRDIVIRAVREQSPLSPPPTGRFQMLRNTL